MGRTLHAATLPLFALILVAGGLPGQAQSTVPPRVGLLVVAHGADSGWNAGVRATVQSVAWPGPRAVAFLMGPEAEHVGWNQAVAALEARGIDRLVVVPLMVSSHGGHYRQVRHYAGLDDSLPATLHAGHLPPRRPSVPVVVTGAIDGAGELGEIMAAHWAALPDEDRASALMMVAHGPVGAADAERWTAALDAALMPLTAVRGGDAPLIGLLRDDASAEVRQRAVAGIRARIEGLTASTGDSVVVMTVLVSTGSIDRQKVPADLAGLSVRYRPTVLAPHPALARWIARVAREAN